MPKHDPAVLGGMLTEESIFSPNAQSRNTQKRVVTASFQGSCETRPLRAIVVLERITEQGSDSSESAEAEKLHGAQAMTTLIPHALLAEIRGISETDMISRYAGLIRTMPVLGVRFRPDAHRIPALIDFIRRRLGLDETR